VQAVKRVGKAIGPLFDKVNKVPKNSGGHSRKSCEQDLRVITEELFTNSHVFKQHLQPRIHNNFKPKASLFSSLDMSKLKQWMNSKLQDILMYS